jgi:hypothetical protein
MLPKTILSFLFLTLFMGLSNAAALLPRGDDPAYCDIITFLGVEFLPGFCLSAPPNSTTEGLGPLSACACLPEIITKCYTEVVVDAKLFHVCGSIDTLKIACEICGCPDCFAKVGG